MNILISACLLGLPTRYDGRSRELPQISHLAAKHVLIPVCPEQLGGLPTPRLKCTISQGNGFDVLQGGSLVLMEDGTDVSANFLRGAEIALDIALFAGVKTLILTEYSPSCGSSFIKRDGKPVPGPGVTAAMLSREGFSIISSANKENLSNLLI